MRKFAGVLAAAGFAMLPMASFAQAKGAKAAPAPAAKPITLGDVLKNSGIQANGYVDFGSTINNRGANGVAGIGGLQGAPDGEFRLNQVGLTVTTALTEGFDATLDLLAGRDTVALTSDAAGDILLKQGYVSYKNGGLNVMGGRFVTLAGSEVINSSQNQNATRSILFGLQPTTLTGVRASYSLGMVTLTGGLLNSQNSARNNGDNNHNKTYEAQVAVTPFDGFYNAVTAYVGDEDASGNTSTARSNPLLIDVVSSLQVTKAISIGLNYDHFRNGMANGTNYYPAGLNANGVVGNGVALYSSFQICDDLRLGARGELLEFVASPNAISANDNRVTGYEYTLTGDYAVTKNFNVLTDVRFDKVNSPAATKVRPFVNANNAADVGDAMTSLTIKGIYRF